MSGHLVQLTSICAHHKLSGYGGLELETGGPVGVVKIGVPVLARVQHEHLRGLGELADVPPFHLRERILASANKVCKYNVLPTQKLSHLSHNLRWSKKEAEKRLSDVFENCISFTPTVKSAA